MAEAYNDKESKLFESFFKTDMSLLTLFKKINKANPSRSFEGVTRHIRKMKESGWEKATDKVLKKLRVGYLDIETSDLNADIGFIISWGIKEQGTNHYDHWEITEKEVHTYKFDTVGIQKLLDTIKTYDVIWAHYGSDRRFDIPYIRTRALIHGLQDQLPQHMELFIMDTYPIARNKLKLHSNRLQSIGDACGVTSVKKTFLDIKVWGLARAGHQKSIDYIAKHNRNDILLLERIHKRLAAIDNKPVYKSI